MGYEEGELAQLTCAVKIKTAHQARIMGRKGAIFIPDFLQAKKAIITKNDGTKNEIEKAFQGKGFTSEIRKVINYLEQGLEESSIMSLNE